MQPLSSRKVGVLSYVTLGAYDVFWLARTRRILIQKTAIAIPDVRWLVWLVAFRVICLMIGITAVLTILNNSGGISSGVVIVLAFFALSLSFRLYTKWLMPFVKAVAIATEGSVNETAAMSLLLITPSLGLATIQQALNDPTSMSKHLATMEIPRFQKLQRLEENKPLKTTLTVVVVIMVVLFLLLISFPFLIDRL